MKTLMKKALCLIMAAVLFIVPVSIGAENVDEAVDVGENYINYGVYLSEGTNSYALSELYDYTVYAFAPTETGKYTFTVEGGTIGIVSYNAMWMTVEPSDETIPESTVSWECTGVGQEIWVAVKADGAEVTISLTKGESEIIVLERVVYENKFTPVPFTYEGDVAELTPVNTMNTAVEVPVLGNDGYYHIGSALGPIVYVNLSDSKMSLYAASQYGQVKAGIYDEEGNQTGVLDYTEAFLEYYECVDTATQLYPLTEDLAAMFKNVGDYMGWYGSDESAWVGGAYEDAWMFACSYVDITYTTGDINNDDKTNALDANLLKRVFTGGFNVEAGTSAALAADIDGDGKITSMDANRLSRILLGAM